MGLVIFSYLYQAEGKILNFFATLVKELNKKLNIFATDVALPGELYIEAHTATATKAAVKVSRYAKFDCLPNIRKFIQIKYPYHSEWEPGFEIWFPRALQHCLNVVANSYFRASIRRWYSNGQIEFKGIQVLSAGMIFGASPVN